MLIEHVPRRAHTHEHAAIVAVVEDGGGPVNNAPAGDHVVFVAVMLDVSDAAGMGG